MVVIVKPVPGSGKDIEGGLGHEKGTEQVNAALGQHQRKEELAVHGAGCGAGIGRSRRRVLRGQGDEEGRPQERGLRAGHPGVDVQERGVVQGAKFRRGRRIIVINSCATKFLSML